MNQEEIRQVAWVADEYIEGDARGVVLAFHGLGCPGLRDEPSTEELAWARAGGLVVFPYYGPWSWMNRPARAFVDELVDAVYEGFSVDERAPLICTGGSMGGYSSLLYTRYARRAASACMALWPVTDLKAHFSERPDLPRTIRHAFRGCGDDLEAQFVEHSPLCQVDAMPDIPYLLVHGDADPGVSKAQHSDRFVARMRQAGRNVEYIEVPGMRHGWPMPIDVLNRTIGFVTAALGR